MSFDVAFVSNLRSAPSPPDDSIGVPDTRVLAVHSCSDDESAKVKLLDIALNDLKSQHGDAFAGVLPDDKTIHDYKAGTYVLSHKSGYCTVQYIGYRSQKGWIGTNSYITTLSLGSYIYMKVDKVLPELKIKLIEIQKYADELEASEVERADNVAALEATVRAMTENTTLLECESDNLRRELSNAEELLSSARKVATARAEDCKRLLIELERSRNSNDKELNALIQLNTEVADLRRKLGEHNMSSQVDMNYVVRSGNMLAVNPINTIDTNAWNSCASIIKNASYKRLLSKTERDTLIASKKNANIPVDLQEHVVHIIMEPPTEVIESFNIKREDATVFLDSPIQCGMAQTDCSVS